MANFTTGNWKADENCIYTQEEIDNGGDIIATKPDYENSANAWAENGPLLARSKDMLQIIDKLAKSSIDDYNDLRDQSISFVMNLKP